MEVATYWQNIVESFAVVGVVTVSILVLIGLGFVAVKLTDD